MGIVGSLPSDSNAGGYLDLTPYFGGTPWPGSTAGSPTGGTVTGDVSDLLDNLKEYDLSFPIINGDSQANQYDASAVIQLLLGHDVDLIGWNPDPVREALAGRVPAHSRVHRRRLRRGGNRHLRHVRRGDRGLRGPGFRPQQPRHGAGPEPRRPADSNVLNGFFFGDNRPGTRTRRTNSNWE